MAAAIASCMVRGQPLQTIAELSTIDGRVDLRGFPLESANTAGKSYLFRQYVVQPLSGGVRFSRLRLDAVDLSLARINNAVWERCSLTDVKFDHSEWTESGLWACEVSNASFDMARMSGSTIGGNLGAEACSYANCSFNGTDLRDSGHTFTTYNNCSFGAANLLEVDFDGARFTNCKFEGTLDSTAFHVYSRLASSALVKWRKLDTRQFINKMDGVDFENARLRYVNFDGVDLTRCRFARDGRHLVIRNQHEVFVRVRDVVSREWPGCDRQAALDELDGMYLSVEKLHGMFVTEDKLKQPVAVINLDDYIDSYGKELGAKIFALIASVNSQVNQ